MRKFNTIVAATVMLLSLKACKKDSNDNYQMENQSFVTQASSSNNFEIQAGGIALLKGQTDAVKHYGEHMSTDHGAVGNEMRSLASSKGWMIPVALQPKEQANLDLLNNVAANAFDREFMRIMVSSHQEAIDLFSNASGENGVFDSDLRAFAFQKLPSLKAHLQEALTLQTQAK